MSLEKEVSSARIREVDLINQIENLKKRIKENEKEPVKKEKNTPPPPTPPKIDSETLALEKTIDNLR